MARSILVTLFVWTALAAHGAAQARPNVLLLVADDLSPEAIGAYAEGSDPAPTPNLDRLARGGMLFRNAWGAPVCSPMRAALLHGRHGFRTGVGFLVDAQEAVLAPDEVSLAEALGIGSAAAPRPYATAAFGKWHLGGGVNGPIQAGFGAFAGNLESLNTAPNQGYYAWEEVRGGVAAFSTKYNTTAIVDDVLAWTGAAPEPWFAYVAFNAPHRPFDAPPAHLHDQDLTGSVPLRVQYKAVVQALDREIGRLLVGLGASVRARTQILFLSDNGVDVDVAVPPIQSDHAKGSLYQGGIRVPLIAAGPLVGAVGAECHSLVTAVDVFATVLDIAGVAPADVVPAGHVLDARSFAPCWSNPAHEPRAMAFSEVFMPNGKPFALRGDALRERRFKAVWLPTGVELYDLALDPWEQWNLLAGVVPPPPGAAAAFARLARARQELLQSEPLLVPGW